MGVRASADVPWAVGAPGVQRGVGALEWVWVEGLAVVFGLSKGCARVVVLGCVAFSGSFSCLFLHAATCTPVATGSAAVSAAAAFARVFFRFPKPMHVLSSLSPARVVVMLLLCLSFVLTCYLLLLTMLLG